MHGQWLGNYNGNNHGHLTLNIELIEKKHNGEVILFDNDNRLPSLVANISLQKRSNNKFTGKLSNFIPINPLTLSPTINNNEWELIRKVYPNITIPKSGILHGEINSGIISGEWSTDIKTKGKFNADFSKADQPSSYPSVIKTWAEYKKFVSNLKNKKNYIFRGQSHPWKLRTSFHRTNRCNLTRYALIDVPILHKHICAESGKKFDLSDPYEHGALLYLAQHHGYPTPLLDWTCSPYIAAYFAFSHVKKIKSENEKVRIHIFDKHNWNKDAPKVANINSPVLSLTLLDLLAINNKRPIPQQSVTMFSNIDDIENYIGLFEKKNNKNYLTIIEISAKEKIKAMDDLYQMGVTASALFPGLDGVCQTLKEQYF